MCLVSWIVWLTNKWWEFSYNSYYHKYSKPFTYRVGKSRFTVRMANNTIINKQCKNKRCVLCTQNCVTLPCQPRVVSVPKSASSLPAQDSRDYPSLNTRSCKGLKRGLETTVHRLAACFSEWCVASAPPPPCPAPPIRLRAVCGSFPLQPLVE